MGEDLRLGKLIEKFLNQTSEISRVSVIGLDM